MQRKAQINLPVVENLALRSGFVVLFTKFGYVLREMEPPHGELLNQYGTKFHKNAKELYTTLTERA